MIDRDRLIVTLTVAELTSLIDDRVNKALDRRLIDNVAMGNNDPVGGYSYGLQGLADLLGCSRTTANKIRQSGKLNKAIKQVGRKIIIDNEKALELYGK